MDNKKSKVVTTGFAKRVAKLLNPSNSDSSKFILVKEVKKLGPTWRENWIGNLNYLINSDMKSSFGSLKFPKEYLLWEKLWKCDKTLKFDDVIF